MTSMNGRIEHTICGLLWLWRRLRRHTNATTTKKDEESEAKAQRALGEDGDQIANSFHPLRPTA